MIDGKSAGPGRGVLFCLFVLAVIAMAAAAPFWFGVRAAAPRGRDAKSTRKAAVPNYDVRSDGATAQESLDYFDQARRSLGKTASSVADVRDGFARGEASLEARLPHVKVEYNADIRIPEVITPDVWQRHVEFLTPASRQKRAEMLRDFVKQNPELIAVSTAQADALHVTADYTNPDGNLSYAHLEQTINGIEVFRGEIKAGFAKDGRMIRVVNNLAPALDYDALATNFGDPVAAVRAAAGYADRELQPSDVALNSARSSDNKKVFGMAEFGTTADKMYFPTEPGVARPAWRVFLDCADNAYAIIVDAETGTLLWRKNLVDDQTQPATYNVYANPNSFMDVAENPSPFTPGPSSPNGVQGAQIARVDRTLIGNEGPLSFNNNGWITDNTGPAGCTTCGWTDGNAVEAGLNITPPDGVDAPQAGVNRAFNFAYNPPPGMPAPPDPLTSDNSRSGAVTQLFYITNRYHDLLYQVGFTEAARNFQNDNFGRGGNAGDRVRAQAQDFADVNNANFLTQPDGIRGRMRMYVFTQVPGRDGSLDAEVVAHELTHGTSNRLHGNANGLNTNRSGGMGEGWSDFYAMSGLSEATDPLDGIYACGSYVTYFVFGINANNSYYGIRRFPYALYSTTGGTNNRPHNPLTAADVNAGCSINDGAFAASAPFAGNPCTEVHNEGEVWASLLYEVRGKFIQRLGFAVGNRKQLQLVTDGMKLAPLNPSMVQERDAIITAALASPSPQEAAVDADDVKEGFRIRGLGFLSSDDSTTVGESFIRPTATFVQPFSVSDTPGDNDGYPEPGENVLLNISVLNPLQTSLSNVTVSVTGGGTVNYGTIAAGATVSQGVPYTVPTSVACGTFHSVTIQISSDSGAQIPFQQQFRVGVPAAPVAFSNTAAITIPNGAPTTTNGPATPYPSTINVSGVSGARALTIRLFGLTHTAPGDLDVLLVSPTNQKMEIISDQGGTSAVSNIDLTLTDFAGSSIGTTMMTGEYRPTADGGQDAFTTPAPPPIYQLPAPGGTATLASAFGTNGANMNGAWKLFIVDDTTGNVGAIAGGWSITFESIDFTCNPLSTTAFDYDGDHRSDVSVFRPSAGTWFLQQSTAGFAAASWGVPIDKIVPADYDGDQKADIAVYRPSEGTWYVLRSSNGTLFAQAFGIAEDLPSPADFDGDGRADLTVFRPSTGTWWISPTTGGLISAGFGTSEDKPVVGDYNGDGRADLGVFRPSNATWYHSSDLVDPSHHFVSATFGTPTDLVTPADFDGDGKTDVAVFRPSTGIWYWLNSTNGSLGAVQFGASQDIPAAGDFDGDGRADVSVFRPSNGTWYRLNSQNGAFAAVQFGTSGDKPTPAAFRF
jgi:subtilisin-like proprotein convertase family protein